MRKVKDRALTRHMRVCRTYKVCPVPPKEEAGGGGVPEPLEIRPVRAAMIHVDGQTEVTMLISAFRDYAKARKKENWVRVPVYSIACIYGGYTTCSCRLKKTLVLSSKQDRKWCTQ